MVQRNNVETENELHKELTTCIIRRKKKHREITRAFSIILIFLGATLPAFQCVRSTIENVDYQLGIKQSQRNRRVYGI